MNRQFDPALPELMDRPQPVTRELERHLAKLRSLNRWFGSHRLVRHFLRGWLQPNGKARILDVATGSGDIPRLIADHARRQNLVVQIDAIDQQESTIEIARGLSAAYPEIDFICANLFTWDAPPNRKHDGLKPSSFPGPYDIILCSLTLHHFSNEDAVRLLRRCCQMSKRFVLVSDLRRSFSLVAGVYVLTTLIFREPMTRYDARLSAIRAFSFSEMRDLALRARWENFGHKRFHFARQAIWLEAT